MGVVQKSMKHLKDKEKSLDFFLSYLDISKLRLLQIINEKQEELDTIKANKYTNALFLEKINNFSYKKEKTFLEKSEDDFDNDKEEIFFLVDAKEDDKYSEVMYKKLEETLAQRVKPNDLIVTIGNKVNLIAQKMELNIVQHYPYDLYLDENEFLKKISQLIVIGMKNSVFVNVTLMIAQQDKENNQLITRKLAPFDREEALDNNYSKTITLEVKDDSSRRDGGNYIDVSKMRQDSTTDYIQFFQDIVVEDIVWVPNINFFKYKLIETIIRQGIVEVRIEEEIQRLRIELQLLDEKRTKLNDELIVTKRWVNRVRREKETNSIIVLHSAFKSLSSRDFDEVIKKKKDDTDELLIKRARGGGVK